ncbi:hypothetical protein ABB37_08854 [Leptomonas pyrrhocoris]|uniref:Uncharacterized protein n=1 Tax=Leptomonas pyrrhocoris TaxID=157538 RepID=A0A0N0DRY4_LEPPY|nr:hypothetical protein ABB37_08854 [Leptomonas pyrrhocoris]KPA74831.1 hypothetical protein ABB37_08854 [Leptomonas pyrrhocoris]|eukprot:XP_015653270.1 hypothetical protein ABB37_08854 [Leptomonas pyrrhocoris]
MLKKVLKIKGVEGRTALTEFAVNKRVKFLEYLIELHSEEGTLWMNTMQLNLSDIGKYFNIAQTCLPTDRLEYSTAGLIRLPAERGATAALRSVRPTSSKSSSLGQQSPSPDPPAASSASAVPGGSTCDSGGDFLTISIANAPAAIQQRSGSAADWTRSYLPCYAALAISLSEILLIPIGGDDFVECFYGLLVELDVAYAGGPATKALAQRSLKGFRQHLSPNLKSLLQTYMDAVVDGAAPASPSAAPISATASADIESQIKYLFLDQRQLDYTAAPPSYDAVIPALCSVLMFAYRKLCDYELVRDEECVKRILSIDKRLERLFFKRIVHELDKVANYKLLREAFVLSTGALFAELGVVGRGGTASGLGEGADFVSNLVQQQQQRQQNVSSPSSPGKKAFDSSDDEEDSASGSSNDDERA